MYAQGRKPCCWRLFSPFLSSLVPSEHMRSSACLPPCGHTRMASSCPTSQITEFTIGNFCISSFPSGWTNPGTLTDRAGAGCSSTDSQWGQGARYCDWPVWVWWPLFSWSPHSELRVVVWESAFPGRKGARRDTYQKRRREVEQRKH